MSLHIIIFFFGSRHVVTHGSAAGGGGARRRGPRGQLGARRGQRGYCGRGTWIFLILLNIVKIYSLSYITIRDSVVKILIYSVLEKLQLRLSHLSRTFLNVMILCISIRICDLKFNLQPLSAVRYCLL